MTDDEMQSLYDRAKKRLFSEDGTLNYDDEEAITEYVENLERSVSYYERLILRFGQLLDYNRLKSLGVGSEGLSKIRKEDMEYLEKVDGYYKNNLEKRNYMFGYPSNMEKDSYLLRYLRFLESKLYLMNNCGDPYERGNYGMDSKETEREIIKMFAQSFGLSEGEYWGYVTSGGTESNFWAIREGFNKFPNGRLYFSDKTHYSVEKFVFNNRVGEVYPYTVVKSNENGSISVEDLIEKIKEDHKKCGYKPVILVLTWGTTKEGAIDSVKEITDYLSKNHIEFYCHLDAALLGGIASNQLSAPAIGNLKDLSVDSVSISLHKYLGASRANGVLISLSRDKRKTVDYIGQEDSTLLGSRDFPPFSTLQRVKEFLTLKENDHFVKNIDYFRSKLKENGIAYSVFDEKTCNIFVIDKPSDEICKKYQLTTFRSGCQENAHVIIFPFHEKRYMDELISDLSRQTP